MEQERLDSARACKGDTLLPLQGDVFYLSHNPGCRYAATLLRLPLAMRFCPYRAFLRIWAMRFCPGQIRCFIGAGSVYIRGASNAPDINGKLRFLYANRIRRIKQHACPNCRQWFVSIHAQLQKSHPYLMIGVGKNQHCRQLSKNVLPASFMPNSAFLMLLVLLLAADQESCFAL